MNAYDQLKCMEERGVITEAQRIALVNVLNSLPTNQTEVMQIVAAASLVRIDGQSAFVGSPIGTQSVSSANPTDIKSLTIPSGATRAMVSVHGNNIIFRIDGGNPAAATGHVALVNTNFNVGDLSKFKFVAQTASAATIFVSYF